MLSSEQLIKELRVVLASLNEHCPDHASIMGVFSAFADNTLLFEFVTSGQEKMEKRMALPQPLYYRLMLPILQKQFEEHHNVKPAFMIEWFILQDAWKLGTTALADVLARHIWNEAPLHESPPSDPLDLALTTHILGTD